MKRIPGALTTNRNWKGALSLAMMVSLLIVSLQIPAYAMVQAPNKSLGSHDFLIPVYFATDRVRTGFDNFGDVQEQSPRLNFGVKYVLRNVKVAGPEFASLQKMGWKMVDKLPAHTVAAKAASYSDGASKSVCTLDGLVDHVSTDRRNILFPERKQEILIYVHGFYNDYPAAIDKAADLASQFKIPVLAFAWCTPTSKGGFLQWMGLYGAFKSAFPHVAMMTESAQMLASYRASEDRVNNSIRRFTQMCTRLSKANKGKLVVVGHSMGTRLVCRYLESKHDNVPISEVAFCNSDLNAAEFEDLMDEFLPSQQSVGKVRVIRVYTNSNDAALAFSEQLHGRSLRLGALNSANGGPLTDRGIEIIDTTEVGRTELGITGHELLCPLVANMHKHENPGNQYRYQYANPKHILVKAP